MCEAGARALSVAMHSAATRCCDALLMEPTHLKHLTSPIGMQLHQLRRNKLFHAWRAGYPRTLTTTPRIGAWTSLHNAAIHQGRFLQSRPPVHTIPHCEERLSCADKVSQSHQLLLLIVFDDGKMAMQLDSLRTSRMNEIRLAVHRHVGVER